MIKNVELDVNVLSFHFAWWMEENQKVVNTFCGEMETTTYLDDYFETVEEWSIRLYSCSEMYPNEYIDRIGETVVQIKILV